MSHGNNTVRSIFPNVQDGTIVSKWDDTTQSYINNSYDSIDGWLNPNMVITPGEGAVVYAPNAVTYNFRGEVLEGELSNVMPAGAQYSLRGSIVPQSGLLQTKLSYGPKDLDLVQIYNTATQTFDSYTFDMLDGAVWLPAEPFLPVARSAWFQRAQTTRSHEWVQRFWVPRTP